MSVPPRTLFAIPLALVCIALFTAPVAAELFEWTDEDARVHYTNEPRPGVNPVGLAPIALPKEDDGHEAPSYAARRARLNRQRAKQWVDRQDEFTSHEPQPGWDEPEAIENPRPAALDRTARDSVETKCQERHGMTCLQFAAWLQINGYDCHTGEAERECQSAAKVEIGRKEREEHRRELQREDEKRAAR
jgi:hypothetical protein